jgi:hypothetical protein
MHPSARRPGSTARFVAAILVAMLAGSSDSFAQRTCATACDTGRALRPTWWEATSASALEEYLRALQLDTSQTRRFPQTVRAIGPAGLAAMARPDGGGPWRAAFAPVNGSRRQMTVLRPSVVTIVNSSFPFGFDDGAIWAGRGLSAAAEWGAVVTLGPLSARVQPMLVWSQNAGFTLSDETRAGEARFRDPITPGSIDLPQRFGTRPYARLDAGESEVRLTVGPATAGLSNARQTWGPGVTHPLVLGPNAPGFIHGFIGTARPIPIGIGRLHGRVVTGRLEQTEWSPAPDSLARRLAAGAVVTFLPGRATGLELGATRFFHRRWTPGRIPWRGFAVPFTGYLFKEGVLASDDPESPQFLVDNQLASVFVRWAPQRARAEVYAEYARNDASLNVREIIAEPDHQSAYLFGARALLGAAGSDMRVVRFELVNSRVTHLDRVRPQSPFYEHGILQQGHTHRGKLLGSVAVPGGGGAVLGWDGYDARGVTTLELHRIARHVTPGEGAASPTDVAVQYVARFAKTRFGGRADLTAGGALVWELNHNLRRDAVNLNLTVGARFGARSRS